eukprot:COSAG06_NODE_853_length_11950_cov_3.644249_11_plen_116_part_00
MIVDMLHSTKLGVVLPLMAVATTVGPVIGNAVGYTITAVHLDDYVSRRLVSVGRRLLATASAAAVGRCSARRCCRCPLAAVASRYRCCCYCRYCRCRRRRCCCKIDQATSLRSLV